MKKKETFIYTNNGLMRISGGGASIPDEPPKKMGGVREGAGRKRIGVKRPVSITLPEEDWEQIERLIKSGHCKSYADYFRSLHDYHSDPRQ